MVTFKQVYFLTNDFYHGDLDIEIHRLGFQNLKSFPEICSVQAKFASNSIFLQASVHFFSAHTMGLSSPHFVNVKRS